MKSTMSKSRYSFQKLIGSPNVIGSRMLSRGVAWALGMIPKKGAPPGQISPRDAHPVEGVGVQNIEAAPAIHYHLREAGLSDDGVDDERETARARDVPQAILVAEGDRNLRPAKAPW